MHYRFPTSVVALCGDYSYLQEGTGGGTTDRLTDVTCLACREAIGLLDLAGGKPAPDMTGDRAAQLRAELAARFGPAVPVTDAMVAAAMLAETGADTPRVTSHTTP
jgi:hypothetical protein